MKFVMDRSFFNVFTTLILTALLLVVCVGCDSAVKNGTDGEGYITFTDAESSRGLDTDDESGVDVSNLVWAYIAVKKDGLHTVGASEVATSATAGETELVDGKNYVLKPVKEDFGKGLDREVGPFSWGEWKFVLFAYEKFEGGKFTNLIYKGSTLETFTRIDPLASGKTSVPVIFTLTNGTAFPTAGTLKLGSISLIVPQGMKFYNGKAVSVAFTDTATSAIAAFTGNKTLSADAEAGTEIPLTFTSTTFADVAAGVHTLKIEVTYDGSVINTAASSTYTLLICNGVETTLYGDITDLKIVTGTETPASFGAVVCKLGTVEYTSLADAINAATSSSSTITLLRSVDYVGKVNPSVDVVVTMWASESGGGLYVKNLENISSHRVRLSGLDQMNMLGPSKLDYYFMYDDTRWIGLNGGNFLVSGWTHNFYVSGHCTDLEIGTVCNVAGSKGCHLDATVDGTLMLQNGFLDIGASAKIGVLKLNSSTSANFAIVGKPTSVVGNINYIRDGYNDNVGTTALTATQKGAYKKLTLDGNGGKVAGGTATKKDIYGIEGMYVTLPFNIDSTRGDTFERIFLFDNFGMAFTYWTSSDGHYVVTDGSRFVMDNNAIDKTLKANWLECLCFTAEQAGSVIEGACYYGSNGEAIGTRSWVSDIPAVSLEYSTDFGRTWKTFAMPTAASGAGANGTKVTLTNAGDKVFVRAVSTNAALCVWSNTTTPKGEVRNAFDLTGKVAASGPMESLLNKDVSGYKTGTTVFGSGQQPTRGLFKHITSITVAPDSVMKTGGGDCTFHNWYYGCTNLKVARFACASIVNTSSHCLNLTFEGCTSLRYVYFGLSAWPTGSSAMGSSAGPGTFDVAVAPGAVVHCPNMTFSVVDTEVPTPWTIKASDKTAPAT